MFGELLLSLLLAAPPEPRASNPAPISTVGIQLGQWVIQNNGQQLRTTTPSGTAAVTIRQDGAGAVFSLRDSTNTIIFQVNVDGTCTGAACGSGGGVTDATYITQTAHASLSAEQAIGALSSGIMRVATTTGVITSLGDDLPLANLTPATTEIKLFGRGAGAGGGDWQEITVGTGLTMTGVTLSAAAADIQALLDGISTTHGAVLYRNAADWVALGPGTNLQFLQTQGAGANPQWATPAGSGNVTGPGSATDNAAARFDGTTGTLLQNSVVLISDTGAVTGATTISANGYLQAYANKTANYTVLSTDSAFTCDATAGNVTFTLPAAAGLTGRTYTFKKTDSSANTCIVDGNAAETIDGSATQTIQVQHDGITILSDNVNWRTVGSIGQRLDDPGADRIVFWDDSAGKSDWLVPNTGLSISGLNLNADVSASTTNTFTNKTYDAEGTGNVFVAPYMVPFIPAVCQNATATLGFNTPANNPATAACVAGTNTVYGVAQFADGANVLSVQTNIPLPNGDSQGGTWTATIDFYGKWRTSATTGDLILQVATACVADAETGDPAFNTASASAADAAKGTTLQFNDISITGVTTTGCAAGELMFVKILRDPAHASDSLAATAELISGVFTVRISK